MIYYLLLLIGAVMIVLSVDIDKYYQKSVEGLNNIECAIRKTIPGSLVCALLFYAMNGFKLNVSAISVGLGAALAALNLLSTLACFKAYEVGNVSLFTMFRMQGGMLLPFIYGIVFADNKPTPFQIAGIVIMVFALILPYLSAKKDENKEKNSSLYRILCVFIFIVNGAVSIVSYIQSNSPQAVDGNSFLTIYQLESVLLFAIGQILLNAEDIEQEEKKDNLIKNPPVRTKSQTLRLWLCIIIVAVIGSVSYLLQLIGAANLPAVAVYPMVTGGTVFLTAVSGLVFFKEKLTVKGYVGIILTFIATILFVF